MRTTSQECQVCRPRFRALLFPVLLAGSMMVVLSVAGAAGYRFNLTPSMPRGIWQVVATSLADYHQGQVVAVCPPVDAPFLPRGSCPFGLQPLLKEIVGVPGDVVMVTRTEVSINGDSPLPHSAPFTQDSAGHLLPQRLGTWRLTGFWLYGTDSPRSFDSRYFGEVPAACLQGIVKPVAIF